MVLFSPKISINGRTVPGIVYNLNRKIRGLIDSSHTELKVSINFLTLGSTLMAGGRVKNGPFSPKERTIDTLPCIYSCTLKS